MKISLPVKITSLAAFLCLSLFLPFAEAKTTKKEASNEPVKYLFVQSATKAKIEPDKEHPNTYKVILEGVNPHVAYFSDRPHRIAGNMPIEKFIGLWQVKGNDSFKNDPPNAELIAIQIETEEKMLNFAIELTDPQYDKKSKVLTYMTKPLKGGTIPKLETLHHAILFIDDVCLSCWGM